jgi:hypothetical protein
MTNISEDDILNELIFEEKSSNPDLKLFRVDSKIYSDFLLSNEYSGRVDTNLEEIKFTPKPNIIVGVVVFSILLSVFTYKITSSGEINTRALLFLFFIAAAIIFVFISNFLIKRRNLTVIVSSKGISFNDFLYEWTEINSIFFIKRWRNRDKRWFLIIHSNDGALDRYDIENTISYKSSARKIAAYIVKLRNP